MSKESNEVVPRVFTTHDLWGRDGRPAASDVQQKRIGDCYLVAVAGAVAEQTPDVIRNAIGYDRDTGNFTVALFEGGKRSTIQVTQAELRDNLLQRGGSSFGSKSSEVDGGLWPAVIEVGYTKLKWGDWKAGIEQLGKGGDPAEALEVLTGKKPVTLDAATVSDRGMREIARQINGALADGKRVVMGTNDDQSLTKALLPAIVFPSLAPRIIEHWRQSRTDSDGVAGNHVYMVMGARFDPNTNDTVVSIRNPWSQNRVSGPWGRHGGEWQDAAEIQVSLKTMLEEHTKSFNRFDIGQVPPQQRELFEAIRTQVTGQASDAAVALATIRASQDGITSATQLRAATVNDQGKLWVAGNTPGYRIMVDTTASLPPAEQSMRELAQEAQRLDQNRVSQQQDFAVIRQS